MRKKNIFFIYKPAGVIKSNRKQGCRARATVISCEKLKKSLYKMIEKILIKIIKIKIKLI